VQHFPLLISIPHGGTLIPDELKNKLVIGRREIFEDIDPFTQRIYDLEDKVTTVLKTNIARTFVDVSRAPDDLPPKNPDGVVKSHTCFGKVIYKADKQPDEALIKLLLKKYYQPFHNKLKKVIDKNRSNLKFCLDCHTMEAIGPAISPDSGKDRPLICLGNRFGESAPNELIEKLRLSLINVFELNESDVTINRPFAGGFITRNYGNDPLPWIQVEMNRSLYLREPYFDSVSLQISEKRLMELNNKFFITLQNFFS